MMRQISIVNLNPSPSVFDPSYNTYPNGVNIRSSGYAPYIVHQTQAAAMRACANDELRFYDDNDDLIGVFKMMPGFVAYFS